MKNPKRLWGAAVVAALALALAAPFALAQAGHKGDHGWAGHSGFKRGGFGEPGEMMFHHLDLTDAQKAQIQQIRESHQATIAPLMEQLHAKRAEVQQLSTAATFDEATVRDRLVEAAGIEAKLIGERVRIHQEMLTVLTPDQRTKLDEMQQRMKSRWTERRQKAASSKQ